MLSKRLLLAMAFLLLGMPLFAQVEPDSASAPEKDKRFELDSTLFHKFYRLGNKEEVFIPLGRIAFADSVVSFYPGNPSAGVPFNDPQQAIGEPDFTTYRTKDPKYVSIGCGGVLTVKFIDNGFIDVPGPDLVFFEIGPSIEPFKLDISSDGKKWIDLGRISGGSSKVDIADFLLPTKVKQVYYYVRISDLKAFCEGPTPGSDIDAIGAIGAVIRLSLDDKVLFDTDKFSLRKSARKSLEKLERELREIPKAKLKITGYTDSDGSFGYNMDLGRNRAISVRNYLRAALKDVGDYTYEINSKGETHPVGTNATAAGKQENRRVEITVFPSEDFYKIPDGK